MSTDNILSAGTFNNIVSLYSSEYEHISTFSTTNGSGITEITWSPDGRYLYIIPRKSTTVEIWDIRSTGTKIATLLDRQALTNQRLWADLSFDGKWFVSGGTDGIFRAWNTDGTGDISPSFQVKAHDGNSPSVV
jgi:telomerase Cajal body protein 1